MFIPTHVILKKILDNFNFNLNDMENFYYIKEKIGFIDNFPIFVNNNDTDEHNFVTKNFDKFNYIFDAAAIGQYLGGVDPRNIPGNTKGFVNETCVINFDKYSFIWKFENNIIKPFIIIDNIKYPIFNLHIHSKNLKDFI